MVEIISHRSFSPFENKAAWWEIKARPFEGVNGMSEKRNPSLKASGPFVYSLTAVASLCYHKAQGGRVGGDVPYTQHKGEFVSPSKERQSP